MAKRVTERQDVYRVTVHREGPTDWWAEVLNLPGCFASGRSLAELKVALAEAMALYLSTPDNAVQVSGIEWKPRTGDEAGDSEEELKVLVCP